MELLSMNNEQSSLQRETYRIVVSGSLDKKWSDWFDGFDIIHQSGGITLLLGTVTDQAALHGLLAKIRDLSLPLITVERIEG